MRMGDEPENKTGHVIVDILMTSAYAASLAFFHKAIDVIAQKGTEQGISNGYMELPAKASSPTTSSRTTTSTRRTNNELTDAEVLAHFR